MRAGDGSVQMTWSMESARVSKGQRVRQSIGEDVILQEDAGTTVCWAAALSRSSYLKPPALPEVTDLTLINLNQPGLAGGMMERWSDPDSESGWLQYSSTPLGSFWDVEP